MLQKNIQMTRQMQLQAIGIVELNFKVTYTEGGFTTF